MNRRDTVYALLALGAAPLTGLAQQRQPKIHHIGFLAARSRSTPSHPDSYNDAFVQGMRELGYVEGKNLVIEWRFADGNYERLPNLAVELVRSNVDVLVTSMTRGAQSLQRSTNTIPIVFMSLTDPVASRLVASLARPGGNITGVSDMTIDIGPKQMELLKTVVPKLSRIAILVNPASSMSQVMLKSHESAAQHLGISAIAVNVRSADQFDLGFAKMKQERAEAVIVPRDAFFIAARSQIATLAIKNQLPVMAQYAEDVLAGCLMSYGPNNVEIYRRGAAYVDKILKGAKPSELPVEQRTTLELTVNLKTAKTLSITIPQSVLLRADRVIE